MKKLPTRKKQPPKNKKQHNVPFLTTNMIILLVAVFAIVLSVLLFVQNQELIEQNQEVQEKLEKQLLAKKEFETKQKEQKAKYFEEKLKDLEIEYAENPTNSHFVEAVKPPVVKDEVVHKPVELPKDDTVIITPPSKPAQDVVASAKPKLAIIIDDVTTSNQIKKIKDIGYSVNISFLPPNDIHPNSAKIAKNLENYMIHLPLQASNNRFDEDKTLHINDSIQTIENRIQELSKLYPKAKYINNHTGSKFTADQKAMEKLFLVLKKYHYTFVDSRTTANSKATQAANKYGVKLFSRNIFLDNEKDHAYIKKQLQKAINIAKKTGLAIAIGHPYDATFEVLKSSKNLLKDVEVVYVNQL